MVGWSEKHLFLGRTLLLRLQGYQTCVGAGMLVPGLANAVLVQHFVLGMFAHLLEHFGSLLEKHLFLANDMVVQHSVFIGRVDVGRLVGW